VGGVDYPAVELPAGQVGVGHCVGQAVGVGVQSHRDDAVGGRDAVGQPVEKVHTYRAARDGYKRFLLGQPYRDITRDNLGQ